MIGNRRKSQKPSSKITSRVGGESYENNIQIDTAFPQSMFPSIIPPNSATVDTSRRKTAVSGVRTTHATHMPIAFPHSITQR